LCYSRDKANQDLEQLFIKHAHGKLYKGSSASREYFKRRPITVVDSMTVLHSWINCVNVVVENMAKFAGLGKEKLRDYKPWKDMNAINRKLTDAKEKSFQEKIQSAFQITLKNVGHGNTGGGLVGNHAKKFFEHHQEIPALVLANQAQEDIEAYQTLMKKLFYILRIINSDLPVNIKEFNMMCKETRSLIKSKMPYFRYTPTLHTVLFHSWEHMVRYSDFLGEVPSDGREIGRGLCRLGEDAVEMAMGRARAARIYQSFKGSTEANLRGGMRVLMMESELVLNQNFKKVKRYAYRYHKLCLEDPKIRELIDLARLTPKEKKGLEVGSC